MALAGVDVGGTFTDFIVLDGSGSPGMRFFKVPSTPRRPGQSVLDALEKSGLDPQAIQKFVHGTTVATNTVLERAGAKVGLLTTKGFEDVLEIQRIDRAHHYDLQWDKPAPLVPRARRLGVVERINAAGEVVRPLDRASVVEAVEKLRAQGVEAVAVALLFSFINPAHEQAVRDIIGEVWPGVYVSISSDLLREFREYERTSTAVIDAYIKPKMAGYIGTMVDQLKGRGLQCGLTIMKSSGGTMSAEQCTQRPVETLLSGPAGGVVAATYFGQRAGFRDLITFDMGGTSTDVALVVDGQPLSTTDQEIEWGIPVKVPMVDIKTVGAGGGSVAWIDRGGRLKVGPRSAGADPGPACYGRGNPEPTVTDANLVLGYLNEGFFLGGEVALDREAAERAIYDGVAAPLGMPLDQAAQGILDIANANMVHLIHSISVQRGHDPRDFALVAFGGAGPMHAWAIADNLNVGHVVVPPTPGVLSAFGLLLAKPRYDFVQTYLRPLDLVDGEQLLELLASMEQRGRQLLAEGGHHGAVTVERSVDMRYSRQNFNVATPLPHTLDGAADLLSVLRDRFTAEYTRLYGYQMLDQPLEVVNCKVSVVGEAPSGEFPWPGAVAASSVEAAVKGEREVYFKAWGGRGPCPVLDRSLLPAGARLPSPCIIEQRDTTVVIPPGFDARVDPWGNLVLRKS